MEASSNMFAIVTLQPFAKMKFGSRLSAWGFTCDMLVRMKIRDIVGVFKYGKCVRSLP